MSDKIRPGHLERAAYVYIRQSTLHQVRNHQESRRRQYELEARARDLGFGRVMVIDEDLGITGSGSRERPGFGRLLAAVCEGQAGAVLALEASRLARNNRDWHHLIDLCVMTDTLVIDADGVYDPRQLNDRLVLGLKGTMSEFELGLLRQRAQEALREKVRRGEVLTRVPIGYQRTETNGVEMTPDLQVQEAIRGVFAQFGRLASARQVMLWYHQEKILLPALQPTPGGETVVWEAATYNRILSLLKNPIYAGAFAYGRTNSRSRTVGGRARTTRGHEVPIEQWAVLIRSHHPGYISWEEYMANQKQISSNLPKHHLSGPGAAKNGSALLTGLLRCSRCGRKLQVGYTGKGGKVTRYACRGAHLRHGFEPCLSLGGLRVDEAVERAMLEALQPLGIEASLRALTNSQQDQERKRKGLNLAVEKARYEAERARRQYDVVDPENRLVAAELEARWNAALERVTQAEAQRQGVASNETLLSEEQRQRLMELGANLTALWNHPEAPSALKKRILRTVLHEIMIDLDEKAGEVCLRLHWAGGVHTTLRLPRNRTGNHRHVTEKSVSDLVAELTSVCPDRSIAAILNRLGHRTGQGNTWTEGRVKGLRDHRHIAAFNASAEREWITMAEAAERLKVSPRVVRTLIEHQILPAWQIVSQAPWCIKPDDLRLPEVQRHIGAVHRGKRVPRADGRQTKMAFL